MDKQKTYKIAFKMMLDECFKDREKLDKIIFESELINTSIFSEDKAEEKINKSNIQQPEATEDEKFKMKEKINFELDEVAEKSFNESIKPLNEQEDDFFNTSMTKEFWKDMNLNEKEISSNEILPLIKHNMKITFKEYSRTTLEKLGHLNRLIAQNTKNSKRDLRSKEYIKEIFESHSHFDKSAAIDQLTAIETGLKNKIQKLRLAVAKQQEETNKIEKEKNEVIGRFNQLYDRIGKIVK